jgi:hypothetical protein
VLGGITIVHVAHAVTETFETFITATSNTSQPLGSGDKCPVIQGGVTKYAACNIYVTLTDSQTFSNKTINGASNPITVLAASQLSGIVPPANGGSGLSGGNSGGVLCATASGTYAFSTGPAANLPMVWGGPGSCPAAGSFTGNSTKSVSNTGSTPSGQGGSWDASGNWVANANAVFTNVAQTFTPQQSFGSVKGHIRTASGTSDTLDVSTASTSDCGGTVLYTSTGTGTPPVVTVTLPSTATVPCVVALRQKNSARVLPVCGTAGCGNGTGTTTPSNPQGFTGTYNAVDATIGVDVDANSGGSAAHWVLTGNGQ